jgi:tetratricopeptide (TPR) repeat protein
MAGTSLKPPSSFRKILCFAGALCLIAVAWQSYAVFKADGFYFKAEKALVIYKRQGEHRDQIYLQAADRNVKMALQIWPDNPDYLVLAAQIAVWQRYVSNAPARDREGYDEAIDMLRQALRQRPSHAKTWGMLAEYKAKAGERDQEMFLAREKALELGGADQRLVKRMLRL